MTHLDICVSFYLDQIYFYSNCYLKGENFMKLKILIVEDSETLQDGWKESLLRVTPPIEVIQAFSIKRS